MAPCSARTYHIQRLSAVRQVQLVQASSQFLDLLGMDHNVAGLPLHTAAVCVSFLFDRLTSIVRTNAVFTAYNSNQINKPSQSLARFAHGCA